LFKEDLAEIRALVELGNATTSEWKCHKVPGGIEQSVNDSDSSGRTFGRDPLSDFYDAIDGQRRPPNDHLLSLLRTAFFVSG
jgi:hypothetical protein